MCEPVGCLAEFGAEEFNQAAVEVSGNSDSGPEGGSHAYWRLLALLTGCSNLKPAARQRLEALELQAVESADLYGDVATTLSELSRMGVELLLVSSLSRAAVARFLERFSLGEAFARVVTRDDSGGVMHLPIRQAVELSALDPRRAMYLADTAEGLASVKRAGVNAILMINDYDEGRVLAQHDPAGGIVSLAELPDALRLIEQQSGKQAAGRPPVSPFELFEPD
jgi:phosphoglycolate phosphatase-like HAD superfamily hydrolase